MKNSCMKRQFQIIFMVEDICQDNMYGLNMVKIMMWLGKEQVGFDEGNVYADQIVNDAFHGFTPFNEYHEYDERGNAHIHEERISEAKMFYDMLDAANTSLYDGCREGQSKLSLAARFMNIKADHNLAESCVDS